MPVYVDAFCADAVYTNDALYLNKDVCGNSDATPQSPVRVCEVISALSFALDLAEGQPMGHSVRSCVIGMRLAAELSLSSEMRGDLYYALLMKDAGCSSNAARMFQLLGTDDIEAKRDVKTTDWSRLGWESLKYGLAHVRPQAPFPERVRALFDIAIHRKRHAKELTQIRCERGYQIARRMGLPEPVALAIRSLDELWDGSGQPAGLEGVRIPLLSRIMNLAQTAEVFYTAGGPSEAIDIALKRSGRWFEPSLVKAFCSLAKNVSLWEDVENASRYVIDLAPAHPVFDAEDSDPDATLEDICLAFADVIDAKSPFTYRHSAGVAGGAVAIARTLGLSDADITLIRRSALLHDIGKLSVPNTILDKPDKLTPLEWEIVRKHPQYSLEILQRVPGFGQLGEIAGSHHELLDGSGYFRNLTGAQLSLAARILVVADIYDSLASHRPYREPLPQESIFAIMQKYAPHLLDGACLEALKSSCDFGSSIPDGLLRLSANVSADVPANDPKPVAA